MKADRASARHRLMEAAKPLFRRHGIRKVSVAEICREAGVSKMSFYRHFRGRNDIAGRVLQEHFTQRMEAVESILAEPIPFPEKLRQIGDLKGQWLKSAGDELVREVLSDRDLGPGRMVRGLLEVQARRTSEIFAGLQESGEIRSDLRIELIIHIIERSWAMIADEELLSSYGDKGALYRELFDAVYYGILPANVRRKRS